MPAFFSVTKPILFLACLAVELFTQPFQEHCYPRLRALNEATLIYDRVALSWLSIILPACLSVHLLVSYQAVPGSRHSADEGEPDRPDLRAPRGVG